MIFFYLMVFLLCFGQRPYVQASTMFVKVARIFSMGAHIISGSVLPLT